MPVPRSPVPLSLWFFPAWCGDFRLERVAGDNDRCLLTVEDPTEDDRAKLDPFLAECVKRGWTEKRNWFMSLFREAGAPEISEKGETVISLSAGLRDVGPVLAGASHGKADTWTAVRCTSGVILVDGAQIPVDAPAPTAAVTVVPPVRGCPAPSPAERRASEVLRTFSTRSQWTQWEREGRMRLIGSVTGKSYHVYHRDEAASRNLPRLLIETATEAPVCVWDGRVPAAEEVLGIKLAVEHREGWLRGLTTRDEVHGILDVREAYGVYGG